MIIACNQPYIIPYIGYWQLINAADVFVILDDYAYIKKGWINRNRILINQEPRFINLAIEKMSQNKLISETNLVTINQDKILKTVWHAYHKAPNFSEGYTLIQSILTHSERKLADFLMHGMQVIGDYLGIKTRFIKSSSLKGNSLLKREYRVYDQCARLGADTYINAIGGTSLYDFEEFKKRGITLKFLKSIPVEYKQFNHPFVPNLSILDVIMFNSREEVIKMLESYELVEGNE